MEVVVSHFLDIGRPGRVGHWRRRFALQGLFQLLLPLSVHLLLPNVPVVLGVVALSLALLLLLLILLFGFGFLLALVAASALLVRSVMLVVAGIVGQVDNPGGICL